MSQDNKGFGSCPTIRVVDENAPDGFKIINRSDFDEENDQEFGVEIEVPSDYGDMTKDELGDELNERDIEFSLSSNKPDLIALLVENDEEEA